MTNLKIDDHIPHGSATDSWLQETAEMLVTKTPMPTNSTDPVFKSFLHHAFLQLRPQGSYSVGKRSTSCQALVTTLSCRGVYKLFDRGGASHII